MQTIKQMWDDYALKVLAPNNVGEVQYTETRRAFYGGAVCLLGLFDEIGSDRVTEDAGVQHIQACHDEIFAFFADLTAGRV